MKVLLAVDGSKSSLKAVDCLIDHADWYREKPEVELVTVRLPLPKVIGIGLLQCVSMIPGVSRSGATIMGALAMGVNRKTAAEFSFFLAVPTMFGATVLVIEQESQSKRQYTLVGQDEADMKVNRISIQSPVGKALIGKRVGDFVEVKTPVKMVEYEVVEIRFEEL